MKKLFATFLLLVCVSAVFAGKTGGSESVIANPKAPVCHDKDGRFIDSKECDPTSCGCLFHQIEEFLIGLFD